MRKAATSISIVQLLALASMLDHEPRHAAELPTLNVPPQCGSTLEAYHLHLDNCGQCKFQPFNLCAEGAELIARAGGTNETEDA